MSVSVRLKMPVLYHCSITLQTKKLQVGHPPGAPFYMLVGNLFTQFASDPSQVSRTVNFLNALLSAGCILFLFWSITRLVRSLLKEEKENLSVTDVIIILGSGLVGAY